MFVDFSSLDLSSRVWIFQSETEINKNLEDLIKKELTEFLEKWVSHGIDIISSFEIKYEIEIKINKIFLRGYLIQKDTHMH